MNAVEHQLCMYTLSRKFQIPSWLLWVLFLRLCIIVAKVSDFKIATHWPLTTFPKVFGNWGKNWGGRLIISHLEEKVQPCDDRKELVQIVNKAFILCFVKFVIDA